MDSEQNIDFDNQGIKEPVDIIDANIDINSEEKKQNIKNIESDRKLKIRTLYFVMGIISINIIVSLSLIVANAVFIFKFDKTLYSEKFLSFLLGSQLIVMPFVLLKIITKHLFPNKDK